MNIVSGAVRVVTKAADVTTAAAGAVGGAAVNGIAGGIQGTASGVRRGLDDGSHSSAAAALTLAAIGAAGLVEWPILLAVGGTALVVHRLNQRSGSAAPTSSSTAQRSQAVAGRPAADTARRTRPTKTTPTKSAPTRARKSQKAVKRAPARPRRTSTT